MQEADEFYDASIPCRNRRRSEEVARQGYAGLLWSKQFYHYVDSRMADRRSCAATASAGAQRRPQSRMDASFQPRRHLDAGQVGISWFAAWDLAFHMIPLARIDPQFAKKQLILFLREWYMHPNGQIPAYEFAFGDVNPPVHAWAAWRVYKMTGAARPARPAFLESVFQKLLLNFTWWVNRKDVEGNNSLPAAFSGWTTSGCSIARSRCRLADILQQADGTAWMGFYCVTMLSMALELAADDPGLRRHGVEILRALRRHRRRDELARRHRACGTSKTDFTTTSCKVDGQHDPAADAFAGRADPADRGRGPGDGTRSTGCPGFNKRMEWFLEHRKDLAPHITYCEAMLPITGTGCWRFRLASGSSARCGTCWTKTNSSRPTASARSRAFTASSPYVFRAGNEEYRVDYVPGEGNELSVRRQLELARSDLVPDQLSCSSKRWNVTTTSMATLQGRMPDWLRKHDDAPASRRRACAPALEHLPAERERRRAHVMAIPRVTRTIRTGRISCCFTNISTAKPAAAAAQVIRPDGRRSR